MKTNKIAKTVFTTLSIISFFLIIFIAGRLIYTKVELNTFVNAYLENENKQFIFNEGIYNFWSDEQIENFDEVKIGEINADDLKKERDALENTIDEIVKEVLTSNYHEIGKIVDGGIVKLGFIADDNFLYIYENNTMLLKNGNKFISYNINDISQLVAKYIETKQNFEINPYY